MGSIVAQCHRRQSDCIAGNGPCSGRHRRSRACGRFCAAEHCAIGVYWPVEGEQFAFRQSRDQAGLSLFLARRIRCGIIWWQAIGYGSEIRQESASTLRRANNYSIFGNGYRFNQSRAEAAELILRKGLLSPEGLGSFSSILARCFSFERER